MSIAINLARRAADQVRLYQTDLLRPALVLGCAATLILAGQPFPF